MALTKKDVAGKLAAYLRHEVPLEVVVDWAEETLREAEFASEDAATLAAVVARLGVSDVRAFGLSWADCEDLLAKLGFAARIDVVPVGAG